MSADDSGAQSRWNGSAADRADLEHDLRLLQRIRDGLASQPGRDQTVNAVTGLIEERQAELERTRRPPA